VDTFEQSGKYGERDGLCGLERDTGNWSEQAHRLRRASRAGRERRGSSSINKSSTFSTLSSTKAPFRARIPGGPSETACADFFRAIAPGGSAEQITGKHGRSLRHRRERLPCCGASRGGPAHLEHPPQLGDGSEHPKPEKTQRRCRTRMAPAMRWWMA